MGKLDIEIVGFVDIDNMIMIDGKFAKLKKTKNRTYECSIDVSDKCEVCICKYHQYATKNWFWWNLLCYLISFFGIFDMRHDKKFPMYDGRFIVKVNNDSKITFKKINFEDCAKFLNVETDCLVEEVSNAQYYDKQAKIRHSKMKKVKLGIFLTAVITTVALLTLL